MGLPIRKNDAHYTYKDYRGWPDDERWELIDGVAYNMSPAPRVAHQEIAGRFYRKLSEFLDDKACRVFLAPVDVFLRKVPLQLEDDIDTIVQPDLLVVCDNDKVKDTGIWGTPDLVVEILSPSTSRKDLNEKYNLYERSGVKEYWVVDPPGRWVQQYILGANGRYAPEVVFVQKGTLVSAVLPGLEIDLSIIWPDF